MSFIYGLLGTFFGIILVIVVIALFIKHKIKKTMGTVAWNELKNAAKNQSTIKKQEYARPKNVMGMTKLAEPLITKDIPDFNKERLYSMVENNLIKIFDCLEKKSTDGIKGNKDFDLIFYKVEDKVREMNEKNYYINFDGITFNNHAIKEYKKGDGMATIVINTSLGYFYETNIPGEENYSGLKKETRYTSEFVYVFDETKAGYREFAQGIHCPNCGAPFRQINEGNCEYCGIFIKPINLTNLKFWKMANYKEDFKSVMY